MRDNIYLDTAVHTDTAMNLPKNQLCRVGRGNPK